MRRASLTLVWMAWLLAAGAAPARAQDAQSVDGVAARIEDDVVTESEVRELAEFQQLVDGQAKSRDELIRELADQWIVRGEAEAAKFAKPAPEDVDRAFAQLVKQFPSPDEFRSRRTAAGLSEAGVRRQIFQQIYLSRFLDYRFRPAAQVDEAAVQAYYRDELTPQLKARGQPAPPVEDVEDTIREVLVQRAINDRAKQWLDETRDRLRIDTVHQGERP